ncbi:MAG: ABC transporter ATP-binding protein [Clostridia bacterium]|nr:ABC transporter ATP-binding protein [Clostridia bacterium]
MKTLLKYLRPYAKRMSVGFTVKVLGTVVELFLPLILTHILEVVVLKRSVSQILLWGGLMVTCALSACILNIIANRMASKVSRNFSENIRRDLFASTLRLSASQTDSFTVPSLESRITTDTYNVHNFVGMMQRMGVRAPILLIGGIGITLIIDTYLSLTMLAILPFIFLTVYFISGKGVPLYAKVQRSVDRMVRVVREDIQGIRVIKALSKTETEHRRFNDVNSSLVKDETKAGIIMGSVNPILTMLMNFGIVAVIALSASRVSVGKSSPATVIAFMQYFTQISMAMMTVTRMFVMYTKSAASANRIAEVLNTSSEIKTESCDEYPLRESDYHIEFNGLSFSYLGKQNDLEDINIRLKKGEKLGIIGSTGSGKSTLTKMLLRFYDPQKGEVLIDGRNVKTIPPDELYRKFGIAMQYDFLYADTIEENIKLGRPISHENVEKAARIAQAHEFISSFDDGYSHILSQKGTNISGGQKQRLLIARAIAAEPEILILDDSSSALDYKTDAMLRRALAEELSSTTVITVAQRVSSVMSCDVIVVLDKGKIIGIGTHDELLKTCLEYREISDSQVGGAIVE